MYIYIYIYKHNNFYVRVCVCVKKKFKEQLTIHTLYVCILIYTYIFKHI